MAFLKLRDPGVVKAIKETGLGSLPRVGRGFYSSVHEDGAGNIVKLTLDRTYYELHTGSYAGCYTGGNKHFAKIIEDGGIVGEQGKNHLYMIKVEKLSKLKSGSENKKLATKLCKEARVLMASRGRSVNIFAERGVIDHSVIVPETLYHLADSDIEMPETMREALRSIALFAQDYDGVGLDFHIANFMERESDGVLVFSDPTCDVLL